MRKCPRCDVEMHEGFLLRAGHEPVELHKTGKLFGSAVCSYLKAAVCPECGEVSIFLPTVSGLERWVEEEPKK